MQTILYSFAPQDRSGKIRWLLLELGIPFEIRTLNGEKKEHKRPEFTSLSPMGLVPVLQQGEVTLFESSAIAIYLTEKSASERLLAPGTDSRHRGDFLKWVVFASTSLDPLLVKVFRTKGMSDEERASHLEGIYREFQKTAEQLEQILAESRYIVGGEFGAADIMLAQPLDWANTAGFLKRHPILEEYLERLKQRPACVESQIFQE